MPLVDSGSELIRQVLVHGPIARSDLSQRLGLSPSSLTRIVRRLLDLGLLVELEDLHNGDMGRPTKPLVVAPHAGRVAGIKVDGDRFYLVVTDAGATELSRSHEVLQSTEPQAVADQLASAIQQIPDPDGSWPLLGVGVCLGGNTDANGKILRAPFLGWRDVPFADMLSGRIGRPVLVENDVVALSQAEHLAGVVRGLPNFTVITIGLGVGYGLVMHNQAVKAADTGLGLGGHIPLDPTGPLCSAGHRGCAEAMLTKSRMCMQLKVALGRDVTYDELLDLAKGRNCAAQAVVRASGAALGRLIALSANLTMNTTVVLTGDGIGLWDVAEEEIRAAIARDRDVDASPVEILVDHSDFEAWARGAAVLAIERALARLAQ